MKKILIVDDETTIRTLCEAVLRRGGFEFVSAVDGREGLAIYRERQSEFCLVLCDVAMPLMDGIEMVREIFGIHAQANVIMMSGYDPSMAIPESVRRFCSVMQKPFTAKQLIEAVQKCLRHDEEKHSSAGGQSAVTSLA